MVGVQEKVLAERAAAVLLGEQEQDAAVEQGWVLPASPGPVVGLSGVVRRRRTVDGAVSPVSPSGWFMGTSSHALRG